MQKEKRATEDEMVGWYYQGNGYELGQSLGDAGGQGGLVCCSPCGHKESEMTWRLNHNWWWETELASICRSSTGEMLIFPTCLATRVSQRFCFRIWKVKKAGTVGKPSCHRCASKMLPPGALGRVQY